MKTWEKQKTNHLYLNGLNFWSCFTPCSWFWRSWAAATLWMLGKYQMGWLRMSLSSSGISEESTTSSPQGCEKPGKSGQEVVWLSLPTCSGSVNSAVVASTRSGDPPPTSSWLPRKVGLVLKSLRMESRSDAKLFNICNLTKIKMSTAMKLNVFFSRSRSLCESSFYPCNSQHPPEITMMLMTFGRNKSDIDF